MDLDYLKATQEDSSLVQFSKFVLALKTIPRKGWQKKLKMKNPESVADHAYSVAALAMILSDQRRLDTTKILKMAILHDLAESVTGDITPDEMTRAKKEKLENTAMKKVLGTLEPKIRKQYLAIWSEYEKNFTKEAKLLHQIDKLEMVLQANAYNENGIPKKNLKPFFDSAKKQTSDSELARIIESIE